jgi:hypothetical protein
VTLSGERGGADLKSVPFSRAFAGAAVQPFGPMAISGAPARPPNVSEVIDFGPKEMRASVVSIMIVTIILENRVPTCGDWPG